MRFVAGVALVTAFSAAAGAQARDRLAVGSEAELRSRLGLAGRPDPSDLWAVRPLGTPGGPSRWDLLDPTIALGHNSAFPWQMDDGSPWRGRSFGADLTAGISARAGWFSFRVEPRLAWRRNAAFPLHGDGTFADPLRPDRIDLPQRFGDSPLLMVYPGESFARIDVRGLSVRLSTERLFWGPGVRHALVLGTPGPGFPHVALQPSAPLSMRIGAMSGQLIYGRLAHTPWAPPPGPDRFASGLVVAWRPWHGPLEVGAARFIHREWPSSWIGSHLLAPFANPFFDTQIFAGGASDNQFASVFLRLRAPEAGFEVFGELGRADRGSALRDLLLQPEHTAAWLLGFLKSFGRTTEGRPAWSVRYEAANGGIPAIQATGRPQVMWGEHNLLTQGHTHRGQALFSPLIERAGGSELAVDRWTARHRLGIAVVQRQIPEDRLPGMPRSGGRTQWALSLGASWQRERHMVAARLGRVWDLNRFPGDDASSLFALMEYTPHLGRPAP